jgi:hypothetical protein
MKLMKQWREDFSFHSAQVERHSGGMEKELMGCFHNPREAAKSAILGAIGIRT